MDETAKLIALFALAAFATERILASANYLIATEMLQALNPQLAQRKRLKTRRKLLLLALAGALALLFVDRLDSFRILRVLQGASAPPAADYWLTWLVLFTGADRVRDLLQGGKSGGGGSSAKPTPIVTLLPDKPVRELRQVSHAG